MRPWVITCKPYFNHRSEDVEVCWNAIQKIRVTVTAMINTGPRKRVLSLMNPTENVETMRIQPETEESALAVKAEFVSYSPSTPLRIAFFFVT
jgi:hypothetical protein